MSYPTDVKVGDTVYIWGGDGFTKAATVEDVHGDRPIIYVKSDSAVRVPGEWFYEPRSFPIPERPKRKTRVELHGMARRPSPMGWEFTSSEDGGFYVTEKSPAILIIETEE